MAILRVYATGAGPEVARLCNQEASVAIGHQMIQGNKKAVEISLNKEKSLSIQINGYPMDYSEIKINIGGWEFDGRILYQQAVEEESQRQAIYNDDWD